MRLILVSYIITNYEQSTFRVFQSRFEDGGKPDIRAISLASTGSHTNLKTKIGVSLGLVALFLLSLLAVIFFVKKKTRLLHQDGERDRETVDPRQHSIQEIANNSLTGQYQELPDSGKAELVDPFPTVAHELPTQRSPDATSRLRDHASSSKYITFVSTNMSTQSRTSIDTSSYTQCAETKKLEPINLNRPLPPTPISESPQLSIAVVDFNNGAMPSRRDRDPADVSDGRRSPAVQSICRTLGHVTTSPTRLNAWQRRFTHFSYASMDMEIVVPPGVQDVEIIPPLNVIGKSESEGWPGNFF